MKNAKFPKLTWKQLLQISSTVSLTLEQLFFPTWNIKLINYCTVS